MRSYKEIGNLIQSYGEILNSQSDKNKFRACMYNKIDERIPEDHLKQLKQLVPKYVGQSPVDPEKWRQAMMLNPDPDQLMPVQISSVTELKERTLKILNAVKKAKTQLKEVTENMQKVKNACDDDIRIGLKTAHNSNQQIKNRLTSVFGKFEQLLLEQGRAQVMRESQEELIKCQVQDIKSIQEPATGMLHKLALIKKVNNQIKQRKEEIQSKDSNQMKEHIEKQQISDSDLRDMLRVLQKQKEGIEILQNSVNDSARQIMVMDKELDLI